MDGYWCLVVRFYYGTNESITWFCNCVPGGMDWTDCLDWLTGLTDWLNGLTYWLDWLTNWIPADWLNGLTYWLDWLTNWIQADWLNGLTYWLDWLTNWLTDWLTDWRADWTGKCRLTDWSQYCNISTQFRAKIQKSTSSLKLPAFKLRQMLVA